jgi:hypothetical protein
MAMPPPPGRLRKPSTELAAARTMKPTPSGREKILALMVAIPKRTPPSETRALATAKNAVNDAGPSLRARSGRPSTRSRER